MQQISRYNKVMVLLHWFMALLILSMLGVGLYMTAKSTPSEVAYQLYPLHKSFGIIAFLLITLRLIIRYNSVIPALPIEISPLERKLARYGHYTIYALVSMIPVSGFLMSDFAGYPIRFFGLTIPLIFKHNVALASFFNTLHTVLNYALILLLSIHALAPFKHLLVDKVNIFKRMI